MCSSKDWIPWRSSQGAKAQSSRRVRIKAKPSILRKPNNHANQQHAPPSLHPSDEHLDDQADDQADEDDPLQSLSIKQLQPRVIPPPPPPNSSVAKLRAAILHKEDLVEIYCRIPTPEDLVEEMKMDVARRY